MLRVQFIRNRRNTLWQQTILAKPLPFSPLRAFWARVRLWAIRGSTRNTLINYGLSYIGVSPYWQYIIKGAIIVMAVAIDSLKHAKKK